MTTFRVLQFPQGHPDDFTVVGEVFDRDRLEDAGIIAAGRVGTPEPGMAYWLEYLDGQGRWQSAGAVAGGPPSA